MTPPSMTKERWKRIEAVLDDVLDLPRGEQAARLDTLCPDADLRAEVEAFLAADAEAPGFLDTSAAAFAAPLLQPDPHEGAPSSAMDDGARIGPYRVVRELGRGGMGQVFLAERADGLFEQRIALKVLRGDIPNDTLRIRLRTERQILAQLNHPGIARVFDGGVTDDGRPYLVLEYVDGVPIDAYCERHTLPLRARLALFEQVCAAVHHAHRNLVVHRDLKPSNILVTDGPDGSPTVKLLDFGIAKLLEDAEADTERTIPLTQTGERWMTPHYAAPEQVTGGAITTSTDVYALGVLLYELLTGQRPFEALPAHEVARAVVETDPPPPSARAPGAAFSPDLDTVVLKALRKEPALRYASSEALGDDVRRFLDGRPVAARRPTWRYRARKFAGRHRGAVAAAVVALVLVVGGGLWHNARVTAERDRARAAALRAELEAQKAEQVAGFLASLFEAGNPVNTGGDTLTAYDLLDRGAARLDTLDAQPVVQAEMAAHIGEAYAWLGDTERARALLERAVRLHRPYATTDPAALAEALEKLGDFHVAIQRHRRAIPLFEEALTLRRARPDEPARIAGTMRRLASALGENYDGPDLPDSVIALAREALHLLREHEAPAAETRAAQMELASLLWERGELEETAALYREALPAYRAAAARDSTRIEELSTVINNYAFLLLDQGDPDEAIRHYREAIALRRQLDKGAHYTTVVMMHNLGTALEKAERFDEAETVWRNRLALEEEHRPPGDNRIGLAQQRLGSFYAWRGAPSRAVPLLRSAQEIFARNEGAQSVSALRASFRTGIALALSGRYSEGQDLLAQSAVALTRKDMRRYDRRLLTSLLEHYETLGEPERVAAYRTLMEDE